MKPLEKYGSVGGAASVEDRIKVAHGIVEALEEMDFDTREQVSILALSVAAIWVEEKLPMELFESTVVAMRKMILDIRRPDVPGEGKPS